ncbi:S9 family peptidase [Ruegeria sp. HKCCD8929]|uniref:alpha/beta hydrolase family protein n=1 Tax=Ruegeria sp. HKCCD8929 TaxID=2683006 RepID=UPI001487F1E9|nr:hypothetical protein [Ruegeria sp. HKCCD8929]
MRTPEPQSWDILDESIIDGLCRRAYRLGDKQIPAISLSPVDMEPGAPGLLYCHAHGKAFAIGKSEITDGRPALLEPPLSRDIAVAGWTVFCADMPGFGDRQAEGSETALAKAVSWRGKTLIGEMVADQMLALDALWDIARPSCVATLGLSMGGTLAYLVAALRADVFAALHLCVFSDIAPLIETGAHDLHGPYMTIPGLLDRHDMSDIAGLVAPRPQFVATGGQDPLTPDEAYAPAIKRLRAAYDAVPERLTVFRDPAAGHYETPQVRKAVLDFLATQRAMSI